MANEGVNPTALVPNDSVAAPSGVAVNAGNVAVLTRADLSGDATGGAHTGKDQVDLSKIVVVLTGGATTNPVVTVKAGDNPPSKGPVADKAITVTAGATEYAVLEAASYTQSDGTVHLSVADNTCTVSLLELP